ncbi:unnamed protein product [Rhizoctonia solani]|uniref:F-box domain-containing protein n=1 Tax=Rhizoctonia solani TaxID=456999 RepID=A0A8H3BQI6_9AGAM|nr:unnamed protein product [Rhizoctonia solani]
MHEMSILQRNNGLPSETLVPILHFCNYKTIIRLSMTCKRLYEIVHQSTSIQLHIELEAGGLEIVGRPLKAGANYASILGELKGYQDAWLNFRLGPHFQQPFPDLRTGTYHPQLSDKTYFEALLQPDDEGDYIADYPLNRIQVVDFDSSTNPLLNFKKKFEVFTTDLKQDLIVLIQYNHEHLTSAIIHLHHISTGVPHSLARFPTLTARFEDDASEEPPSRSIYVCSMVMRDVIVVNFAPRYRGASRYGDVVIWNWQSGVLLGRILSETDGTAPVFFDKDHLLLYSFPPNSSIEPNSTGSNQVALLIYRVPTTAAMVHQELPNADVYVPSCPSLEPTLILDFPTLHSAYRVDEHILLKTQARPGDVAYRGLAKVAHSHISTVALRLSVAQKNRPKGEWRSTTHYSIYVKLNFLLDYLSENQVGEMTTVHWSQWGAAATRWFINNETTEQSASCGSLHLRFHRGYDATRLMSLLVFDPHIISRQTVHALDEIEQQKVLQGQGLDFLGGTLDCIKLLVPFVDTDLGPDVDRRIASNLKTVIHTGFEEPVESTLRFMVVNRLETELTHVKWYLHGEYLIGGVSAVSIQAFKTKTNDSYVLAKPNLELCIFLSLQTTVFA